MENRNIATYSALAAGGLLLADQVRRRRQRTALDSVSDMLDTAATPLKAGGVALGLVALVGGGLYLSNVLRRSPGSGSASNVQDSIELEVPVSTAYNQWTQFEDFPKFMATVESVKQVDDTHLHWKAVVAGKPKEWDAEITEQIPDQRIAWRSIGGVPNWGDVTFEKTGENRTRVRLQMYYAPESADEKVASALGGVKLATKGNLRRFKHLVEARGVESGAWRGEIARH
jgi:uncharacterized membrane protein